jgi:hypothetical protein
VAAAAASKAVADFGEEFKQTYDLRKRTYKVLGRYTDKHNICFDGMKRVSHVTDATDWRVEYPFVVLTPDSEENGRPGQRLYRTGPDHHPARRRHRLHRRRDSADADVGRHQHRKAAQHGRGRDEGAAGPGQEYATIYTGAGVVTNKSRKRPRRPASCSPSTRPHASCIGGNIAMNAGGKKAVLWGTALDNLASWRMVDPNGDWLEVTRLDHNLSKIHDTPLARFKLEWTHPTQGRSQARRSRPRSWKSPAACSARKAWART